MLGWPAKPLGETEIQLPFKNNTNSKQTGRVFVEGFARFADIVEGWTPEPQKNRVAAC